MSYEAVIGLEVHAQVSSNTKVFCGCSTVFGAEPNSQTCPVCEGLPGVLPVLNARALECIVLSGLALNCKIAPMSRFARKNYFYPDLPKNYQISQYELPVCEGGHVDIVMDGEVRRIGLTRIHLEEDAGKNIHEGKSAYSLVDLNRTGTPLMEIVSEPELRTPEEASAYMRKLRSILRYIGVCDGNMEQGSLRCDANVSVRLKGETKLGTKVELKNINSFRFVERAVAYEIKRQIQAVKERVPIIQETRLFDPATGATYAMRAKEEAHDYRYFPDPDLVPIVIEKEWLERLRVSLPELPDARRQRFVKEHGLPEYDAELLTGDRGLADWYEAAVKAGGQPKAVSNWVMGELMRLLNDSGSSIEDCPLRPARLSAMLKLIDNGTLSLKLAKTVFEEMYREDRDPMDIVRAKGLVQVSDEGAIGSAVEAVIAANPGEVARFKAGEEKLLGFFVGQVMKAMKGKGNPQTVNELVRKKLAEYGG